MILASQTLGTVLITIIAFLIVSLLLISVLLFVKQKLSPSGPVMITINGEKEIEVASGETLLTTLGAQKIFLQFMPSCLKKMHDSFLLALHRKRTLCSKIGILCTFPTKCRLEGQSCPV